MPMSTWNVNLVSNQRTCRNHSWDPKALFPVAFGEPEAPPPPGDDMLRLPANSKSRFDLEEQNANRTQTRHCFDFLTSLGINRDLTPAPPVFRAARPCDPYSPPRNQAPFIGTAPACLAGDLFQCSTEKEKIVTVEDKDPSVLWQINSDYMLNFWFRSLTAYSDRWEIHGIPDKSILHFYTSIIDSILPNSLFARGTAFSTKHIPYTYFTVKYKCFKHASERCGGHLVPPNPALPAPLPQNPPTHPAHTCRKPRHSCLRNIMSFKQLPGRATFKRVGRAFSYGLRMVAPGYGLRDLSRGKKIIENELAKQKSKSSDSNFCCLDCGAICVPPHFSRPMPDRHTKW